MKKDIVMKRRMMSDTIVRLFAIVAVALLTVGIFASLSRETEVYASKIRITQEDGAIIRSGPSVASKEVGDLDKDRTAKFKFVKFVSRKSIKNRNKWYYLSGYGGYVRGDLAAVTASSRNKAGVKTVLNLRKGPGKKFAVVKTLKKSAKVLVLYPVKDYRGKPWYRVVSGKKSGYIISKYVKTKSFKAKSAKKKRSFKRGKKKKSKKKKVKKKGKRKNVVNSVQGFPDDYKRYLEPLQAKYPNWKFVPVDTGLDWTAAAAKMSYNPGANTVWHKFPLSYRSTEKGYYNYLKDVYKPKDGNRFFAASDRAVKYYMDPRNWIDDVHIFMFQDYQYHDDVDYLSVVKTLFSGRNKTLYNNADSFVKTGKKYNLSPIYLAAKAYEEQGSGVNSGIRNNKRVYNVFNIGASDSPSGGAANGINWAASKSNEKYGTPWTSIPKAVDGGAKYLSLNFVGNNQNTAYFEHFNVLNGISQVGTHVYMTALYAAKNTSETTAANYRKYGIYDKSNVFHIPVYRNMPASLEAAPSSGNADNNFYLKSLFVQDMSGNADAGNKTVKISANKLSYAREFSCKSDYDTVKIVAEAAGKSATVSGTGVKKLQRGVNVFYIKCKASSGETRTYTLNIERN